jgi:Zn-dependent protease with chaperone function
LASWSAVNGGTCPECGTTLFDDERFVVWCDRCNWNVDPDDRPSDRDRGGLLDRLAQRLGDRLYEQLRRDPDLRPRWGAAAVATYVFATFVHLFVLLLVAVAVFLVVDSGPSFVGIILGLLVGVVAVELRPRAPRLAANRPTTDRTESPTLFELLDRISNALGADQIMNVVLSGDFNAGFVKVGWRQRSTVVIGLPLWAVLEPQERVALLGHELAHEVNGDAAHTFYVGSATGTLTRAYDVLRPASRMSSGPVFLVAADRATRLVQQIGQAVIRGVLWIEMRIDYQASQRAEYRADELAVGVASSDASIAVLDKVALAPGCLLAIRIAREKDRRAELMATSRSYVDGLTDRERERWRRRSLLRNERIDDTHPPTRRRIDLIRDRPPSGAAVELSAADSTVIDDEVRAVVARWRAASRR